MVIRKGTKFADILGGTSDADKIYGMNGNDTISGGDGYDRLYGGGGDDDISGGDGNDLINGNGGNDEMNGGADIDDLRGGGGNDEIDGGSGNDKIFGGGGNDSLSGGLGADRVLGDAGNDTISGDQGDDYLLGGVGADTISGGSEADYINGGVGNDVLYGGSGNDYLYGVTENDWISGDAGDDVINAGIGDDTASGGDGNDIVIGEVGNDTLYGNAGNDSMYSGFGNDIMSGGDGDDYMFGDTDNDTVDGDAGNDTLLGGDGNDALDGGTGNDTIDGGNGQDTVVFSGNLDEYDIVFIGTDIIATHARGTMADGVDTVRGSVERFEFADSTVNRPDPGADDYDVSIPADTNAADNLVTEGVAIGTVIGLTAHASDSDFTNNTITYSLTDSASGLFQINSTTGVITTAAAINAEVTGLSKSVTIQAASSDGSVATQTFTIGIGDVDEFNVTTPTDSSGTANAVTEGASAGTTVGITVSASDADILNNTISYSLSNDAGGLFQIDASTGVVSILGAIDRETIGASTSITALATSADGSTASQSFTIAISDVDEFDVTMPIDLNATSNAVNENAAAGTLVGVTVSASDADATSNTITYSLTNSAGGRFQINASTGVISVASIIDRESLSENVSIIAKATSADGSFTTEMFTIAINDVNEAPTLSVAASANATQISFTAADQDAGDSLSIESPFSSIFSGAVNNGSTTTLTVAEQAMATSGTLSVRDTGGLTASLIGLALGSSAANTITAAVAGSANALYGFGGNDTITGGTAADVLVGGAGNDAMTGGSGVDTFYVDLGADTIAGLGTGGADVLIISAGATATVTATAAWTASASTSNAGTASLTSGGFSINVANATGASGWTISNAASGTAVTLTGGSNADTLTGGSGIDTIVGGGGNDTINGGAEGDTIIGSDGTDTIDAGASNDNKRDVFVFTATSEFGDTVTNFDSDGTFDHVRFTGTLNTEYDDITNNDTFAWISGSASTSMGGAANIGTAEALYLGGTTSGEGVANANLSSASAVATAFNTEFAITGSGDALLVINDTDGSSFSVWRYVEAGTSEIQASELTLIGVFSANTTVTTSSFVFG